MIDIVVQHCGLHTPGGKAIRSINSYHARAENDDLSRWNAGDRREQRSPAATLRFEQVCGELREQPAGDLAHRFEHWQLAVIALDQLITDSSNPGRRKFRKPALWQHCQMEKATDNLSGPKQALRRFGHAVDRQQEIAAAVDLIRVIHDPRACGVEIVVGKTGAEAGLVIDIDRMASTGERLYAGRRQAIRCSSGIIAREIAISIAPSFGMVSVMPRSIYPIAYRSCWSREKIKHNERLRCINLK